MDDQDVVAGLNSLTPAECRVLFWVCQGLPRKRIAEKLFVTERTVHFHVGNIYEKLGLVRLGRTERSHVLHQRYCPLLLERVRDPEQDRGRSRGEEEPEEEPSELALILSDADEDDERGYLPLTGTAVPMIIPDRLPPGPPPIWPSWLGPVLLVCAFMLVVVVVLLALNLFWEPQPVAVVVTATPGLTQAVAQAAPTARATWTMPPSSTPAPSPTPTRIVTPTPTPTEIETATPTPTTTPTLTETPSPTATATPIPTTVAGQRLKPGEVWHQDGMEAVVQHPSFVPYGECRGFLQFDLIIRNTSGWELVTDISGSDF
jgi:DNA-binding CsgD family transcriptional regulator